MEEIKKLKEKYVKTTGTELIELIGKSREHIDRTVNARDQQIQKNQIEIDVLSHQLSVLKEELNALQQRTAHKNQESLKYEDHINKLESEKKKILEEIYRIKERKKRMESQASSLTDKQILEDGKRKLKLYKNLTGIRWDYPNLDKHVAGYVTNGTDYIHHFSYKKEEDPEKLRELLWNEIHLSTGNNTNNHTEDKKTSQ